MKDLRGLDDRVLPAAAARVRALRDVARQLAVGLSGLRAPQVRSLRELDRKYTGSGPLALFRDIPQLGFLLIGVVFVIGTGTAVSRQAASNRAAAQSSVDPLPGTNTSSALPGAEGEVSTSLGPAVGDVVSAYVAAVADGLATAQSKGGERVALVSLRSYLTPGQAKDLLDGYVVRRVYLRSRSGGKDAAQLPVNVTGDLGAALTTAYADAARGRSVAQRAYQKYVDTLTVVTKEDKSFRDLYAAFAASTGAEAGDYRSSCACVYAVIVSGSPPSLAALAKKAAVRAVQVADRGQALPSLDVLPLLPDVTGIVPAAQAPVDPP